MQHNKSDLSNKLNRFIKSIKHKKIVVAVSGGTDSLVLSKLVKKYAKEFVLAIVVGPNIPLEEINRAKAFANYLSVKIYILTYDPLSLPALRKNTDKRCYACKREMFRKLTKLKEELGYDMVIDGTKKTDLSEFRPGLKALKEFNIVSPFALSGITKADVLAIGKELKLDKWLMPSNTCYATRIMDNQEITIELLNRIREAEQIIRNITGLTLVRARMHVNNLCRIEVNPEHISKVSQDTIRTRLVKELSKIGIKYISLDLKGYKN